MGAIKQLEDLIPKLRLVDGDDCQGFEGDGAENDPLVIGHGPEPGGQADPFCVG